MGDIQNRGKKQNGSITLFVLIACTFVITILLSVYVEIMNKNANQERDLTEISKKYFVSERDLENSYIKIINEMDNISELTF